MQAKNPKIHVERSFYRSLLALTLPVALQNVISYSVNLMDTLMLGGLGEVALSATSLANQVFFIYTVAIFGVAGGAIVLCSQYWGKKDLENISRAMGVAAYLGVGIAAVLAAAFFLWPVEIMDLLSNKHELSLLGAPYLRIIGFSYVFNMLSSIYVSAQRSVENSSFGMKLFGMSTAINTGMNYLLIFGKAPKVRPLRRTL